MQYVVDEDEVEQVTDGVTDVILFYLLYNYINIIQFYYYGVLGFWGDRKSVV